MSEIDAMKSIEVALDELDEAEKKRALDWACARFLGAPVTPPPVGDTSRGKGDTPVKKKTAKKKSKAKTKGKVIYKQIKDLNLRPSGKTSGKDFALEKKPTNTKQKCVVAVYYLRDVIAVSTVTVNHVFTFFKNAGWPAPTDLINTLQQAGSAGWLDTADAQNILITPIGENLIEHELPKPAR